jgi:hypothetical protein
LSTETSQAKWLDFYRPHFPTEATLVAFVEACVAQAGPTRAAKIIMHQVRRLIMLADQMETLRPRRDSLSIFWYVVCAEAASKLQADDGDRDSKPHARRFFAEFSSTTDRQRLASGFRHPQGLGPMSLLEAVDTLYAVRCSVAHEGNYWEFTMSEGIDMINVAQPAIVSLTLHELRDIVVRTGIAAAQSRVLS